MTKRSNSAISIPARSEPEGCSFCHQAGAPMPVPMVNPAVSQSTPIPVTTDTQTSGSYQLSSHHYTNTTVAASVCPATSNRDTSLADQEDIQAGSLSLHSMEKSQAVISSTTLGLNPQRRPTAESTRLGSSSSLSQPLPAAQPTAESTRVENGVSSKHLASKVRMSRPAFDRPQCWTTSVWDNYHELKNMSSVVLLPREAGGPNLPEMGTSGSLRRTSPGSDSNKSWSKNQDSSSSSTKQLSLQQRQVEVVPSTDVLSAFPGYIRHEDKPGTKPSSRIPATPDKMCPTTRRAHVQLSIASVSDDPTRTDKASKRQQSSDSQSSGSSGGSVNGQSQTTRTTKLPPKKRHCRNLLQRLAYNFRRCARANVSSNMSSANNTLCYLPANPSIVSGSGPSVTKTTNQQSSAGREVTRTEASPVVSSRAAGENNKSTFTTLSEVDLDKTVAQLQSERGTDCIPRDEAEIALCLHHFLHQPQLSLFYKMAAKKRKQMSKLATTCYVKAVGSRYGVTLTKTTLSRVPVARDIMWLHFS